MITIAILYTEYNTDFPHRDTSTNVLAVFNLILAVVIDCFLSVLVYGWFFS